MAISRHQEITGPDTIPMICGLQIQSFILVIPGEWAPTCYNDIGDITTTENLDLMDPDAS